MKRAESYCAMADRTRQAYASSLFDPNAIANAIHEQAKRGFRRYRVAQDLPFDLSDCQAARSLENWLTKEDLRYAWRVTYIDTDPLRPPVSAEYPELEIMW